MAHKILLVEDNENDVVLTQEALNELDIDVELEVCRDGKEFHERIHGDGPVPHLIFLDLNLPYIPGHRLLEDLQEQEDWRKVPVCILSSSKAHHDVVLTYSRCANCYIAKPIEFEEFMHVVGEVVKFWFTTAELPKNGIGSTDSPSDSGDGGGSD